MSKEPMTLKEAIDSVDAVKKNCSQTLFGIDDAIENAALAAFTRITYTREGEGILYKDSAPAPVIMMAAPGVGKTDLGRNIAQSIGGKFAFIPGQPDLSASKIMGRDMYIDGSFHFVPGDILSNVVLFDEISRTPPKVQAPFFQAMEERMAISDTFDPKSRKVVNKRMPLTPISDDPANEMLFFWPIATGNPFEQEGTYDLPEAMWDRFAIHFGIDYPEDEKEKLIDSSTFQGENKPAIKPVITLEKACEIGYFFANKIEIGPEVKEYMQRLMRNSRPVASGKPERRVHAPAHLRKFVDTYVKAGFSPRSNYHFKAIVRTFAGLRGRTYVTIDDVKHVAHMVTDHRLLLTITARGRNIRQRHVVDEILKWTPIPSFDSRSSVFVTDSNPISLRKIFKKIFRRN